MSHGKRVLWIVMAGLVLLIAAFVIWQWENLHAAVQAVTRDPAEIAQAMESARQDHQDALVRDYHTTVTPPSTQDSDALLNGSATAEEVKQEIGLTEILESTPARQEAAEDEDGADLQALIDRCIAELYAYKVDLMGQLGGLKQETLQIWASLPEQERTSTKKRQLASDGLMKCYDLEKDADSNVLSILDRYRAEFERLGADASVTDDLWKYYCEEKSAEKAYYIDKYLT